MDNNAYLLVDRSTGEGLLVDAANEADRLLELVGDTPLATVVTTHRHGDHWQALRRGGRAHRRSHGRARAGRAGAAGAGDRDGRARRHRLGRRVRADGDPPARAHPGLDRAGLHRPADGVVHLFTGDSLFPGGPGNTEQDPQRFGSLMDDLEARVFGVLRRLDLGLSRPRQGHDARRRAPVRPRVARPRLVTVGRAGRAARGGGRRSARSRCAARRTGATTRRSSRPAGTT